MIISDYTKSELDFFRKECHFVNLEENVFEGRSKGKTLEVIAEENNLSIDCIRKVSRKVNRKIEKVLSIN